MGTIALASVIMIPIELVNVFIVIPCKKLSNFGNSNCVCRSLVACGDCWLYMFEYTCDYINNLGLAYIAITGDNFCEGQWKGFMMNVKYLLEFQYSMRTIAIFSFSLKLIIILLNLFTFIMLTTVIINDSVTLPAEGWIPVMAVFFMFSYVTASMFMT